MLPPTQPTPKRRKFCYHDTISAIPAPRKFDPAKPPTSGQLQQLLDVNQALQNSIRTYQKSGQLQEVLNRQMTLHRNLVFLLKAAKYGRMAHEAAAAAADEAG